MNRYRSPEKPGSQFITAAGAARLKQELDELWKVERPRVTQAVSEAAAQGDRSENAEYTYGKKRLREIDRRVRFLRKRLDGMTVVDKPPSDRKRVYFGAWVTLEDVDGKQTRHRIVGPDEFATLSRGLAQRACSPAADGRGAARLPFRARPAHRASRLRETHCRTERARPR